MPNENRPSSDALSSPPRADVSSKTQSSVEDVSVSQGAAMLSAEDRSLIKNVTVGTAAAREKSWQYWLVLIVTVGAAFGAAWFGWWLLKKYP
jgi:hypothetical protein